MNRNKAALHSPFANTSGRPSKLISLTPLIDVVFILLVFFMLASSFLDWRMIELDSTKKSRSTSSNKPHSIVVNVAADNIAIAGDVFKLNDLVGRIEALRKEKSRGKILLRPTGGVNVQRLVDVLDHLDAAGIKQLSLSGQS